MKKCIIYKNVFSRETESNRRPKDHHQLPLQSSALPTELSRVNYATVVKIAGLRACTGPCLIIIGFYAMVLLELVITRYVRCGLNYKSTMSSSVQHIYVIEQQA